ncbi:RHS repeat-associated core domain-containing protein [Motiliproteus sp. MSK22-1]|uniref:RHS repeat-associated core domain-containing protein n=1 Tax=Motiliproteus sp. MSK22-1 TaxID=1897630 RepID=UPI000977EA0C|nr:RHS repeat-associated core domain-containing protein [Motiliproteus sp. MSK22-1]OMH38975.1 hypothetical protein BGP75_04410 [Motiliproteus sp. MSK22-1]
MNLTHRAAQRLTTVLSRRWTPFTVASLLAALVTALLMVSAPQVTADEVGSIEGDFKVDNGGAASYSIPLALPPGIAGLEPKLTLNYRSGRDLGERWGYMGRGWRLGGLSSIHRCRASQKQDGFKAGVWFEETDRFCLNGQHLKAISGTYGANGTEYRTELDSFSKVVSYGNAGVGPAWFKVWTKSGRIMEFGNSADSRIEAQGKHSVLTWAVNRIQDRSNNEITFSYTEINANTEFVPNRINYGGNSIRFEYADVTGSKESWILGSKVSVSKRLDKVRTYSGEQEVMNWSLDYETGIPTTAPQITTITQCNAEGGCLPATTFDWQQGTQPALFADDVEPEDSFPELDPKAPLIDFDGDGIEDEFRLLNGSNANLREAQVKLGDADFITWQTGVTGNLPRFGDINGDGKTDFVTQTHESCRTYGSDDTVECTTGAPQAYLSTGTGFQLMELPEVNRPIDLGDFNGDGRADLIVANKVALSQGGSFGPCGEWIAAADLKGRPDVGDVNGDGYTDLLVAAALDPVSNNVTIPARLFLSTGNEFVPAETPHSLNTSAVLHDINGDGQADFYGNRANDGSPQLQLATIARPDLITGIHGATDIIIKYKELTDTSIHTPATDFGVTELPNRRPVPLVASVQTDDGIGGTYNTRYQYAGAKYDFQGRGFLGFDWREKTDAETGIITRTTFNQSFPYVGRANTTTRALADGTLISEVNRTYDDIASNNGALHFPYLKQEVEKSYEINDGANTEIITVTKTFSDYDDYGNARSIEVTTIGDGETHTKGTTNTFANDSGNWLLGQLTRAVITHTNPDNTTLVRTSEFDYDPITGQLTKETTEPNDALAISSQYSYDSFGNRTQVRLSTHGEDDRITRTEYDSQGQFPTDSYNAKNHHETYSYDSRFGQVTRQTDPNGLETSWSYDGFGREEREVRPDGVNTTRSWRWASDCSDVPAHGYYCVTETRDGESPITVHYDRLGRELRTVSIGFNGDADNGGSARTVYTDQVYDHLGRLAKHSRAYFAGDRTYWAEHQYDILGRKTESKIAGTDGQFTTTTTAYDGLVTRETNAEQHRKKTTQNVLGQVIQVIDAEGSADQSAIAYSYDPVGNLLTTTDADNNVVTLTYDALNNKVTMDDPDMGFWQYSYNGFGELKTQKDAKGQITEITYDALGRLKTRDDDTNIPSAGFTEWHYDNAPNGIGKLESVYAQNNTSESFIYNALGLVESVTRSNSSFWLDKITIKNTYDAYSRLDVQTRPSANSSEFQLKHFYNAEGFLTAVGTPRESVTDYSAAHLTGLVITATEDAEALLEKADEFREKSDEYAAQADYYRTVSEQLSVFGDYTNFGTAVVDGRHSVYIDSTGRRFLRVVPTTDTNGDRWIPIFAGGIIFPIRVTVEGQVERYVQLLDNGDGTWSLYDFGSNYQWPDLAADLTANSEVLFAGQLDNQGDKDFFIFDHAIVPWDDAVIDPTFLVKLFNASNELDEVADFLAKEANDFVELADNLLVLAETTYRDAVANDLWIENYQGEYASEYQSLQDETEYVYFWKAKKRDAEGRLSRYLSGNGLSTVRNYDPATGQLRQVQTGFASYEPVRHLAYDYNRLNNLTLRTDYTLQTTETYEFDNLERLSRSELTFQSGVITHSVDYQYDALGNLTNKSDVGSIVYGDGFGGRPHAVRSAKGSADYVYDANGNLTSGNGRTIQWSSYNKPTSFSKEGESIQFKYGPDRSRYSKIAGDIHTLYFDKIYERTLDYSGQLTINHKQMIYADGDLVATHSVVERDIPQARLKKGETQATLPSWMVSTETLYMHRDALGSIDTVTDGAGKVVDRMGYDAFGQRRDGSGLPASYTILNPSPVTDLFADKTNRGFTGHEHIDEIGLIHMNGRVYDPELGRFLSADPKIQAPLNSQSFNRYSYVVNNPLMYTDPTGFEYDETGTLKGDEGEEEAYANIENNRYGVDSNGNWNFYHGDPNEPLQDVSITGLTLAIKTAYDTFKDFIDPILEEGLTQDALKSGALAAILGFVDRRVGRLVPDEVKDKATIVAQNALDVKKTVNNPVDLTDFRKDHILNRHGPGTGKPGKTEFPADWDDDKILHEISDVATDPKSTVTSGRWGADRIQGRRDGIDITVDLYPSNSQHAGKISTGYPTNTKVNP